MNRDQIEGRWRQFVGALEQHWGRLIGDETLCVRGERDRWMGQMQQDYGLVRDITVAGSVHDDRR